LYKINIKEYCNIKYVNIYKDCLVDIYL